MNRNYLPLFFLFFFPGLFSCSDVKKNVSEKSETDSLSCRKPGSLNPNGDSELALLMRQMTVFTDSLKDKIAANTPVGNYPSRFENILHAQPTDSSLNRTVLNGFANNYLEQLRNLYQGKSTGAAGLNSIVNSCITCHESFCQGPIKRIKKMLLPE